MPMKKCFLVLALFSSIAGATQSYQKIHRKAILIDTHNDVLSESVLDGKDISNRLQEGHSDLVRFQEGGVDIQFFSIYTGPKARNAEGPYKDANEEIDSLESIVRRNPDRMVLAKTYKEVKRGVKKGRLVALIGVEGGHMIEDDMQKLEALYERGMRYLTLTWNNSTSWASSAMDETGSSQSPALTHKGLNDFGRQVVKRMNELGIIVDLSHTGEQTFYDAVAVSTKPVLLSHSSVWNLCPVFRNVKDDQLKALAKNGGVICINFYSGFVSRDFEARAGELNGSMRKRFQDSVYAVTKDSSAMRRQWREFYRAEMNKLRPAISDLVDHIDYVVKLIGDDYVGIGADYDGVGSLPVGLEDVTTYPKITEELLRRGYSKKSINKILGGNVLRVIKANFKE